MWRCNQWEGSFTRQDRHYGFGCLQHNRDDAWERSVLLRTTKQLQIASFGESDARELFAVNRVSGTVYRIAKR
jgi:hypothetical protein